MSQSETVSYLFLRTTKRDKTLVPIEEDVARYQSVFAKRIGLNPDTVSVHKGEARDGIDYPPMGMVLVERRLTPPGHFFLEVHDVEPD